MPRQRRGDQRGDLHHVTSRGNRRQALFAGDARGLADRCSFEELLGRTHERFEVAFHAVCQMGNHIHLVVRCSVEELSRAMHWLLQCHAMRFNRAHGVDGHLVQGRFHSGAVDGEEAERRVLRYVLLNPVHAGLCDSAAAWEWSSARALLGLVPPPAYLDAARALRPFGGDVEALRRALVPDPEAPPLATRGPGALVAARAAGRTLAEIADELGVSPGRAGQLARRDRLAVGLGQASRAASNRSASGDAPSAIRSATIRPATQPLMFPVPQYPPAT